MTEPYTSLINFIGIAIIGVIQWFYAQKHTAVLGQFMDRQAMEMQHLRAELKVPEPTFHVKQSKKTKSQKPQVIRRTEEDEFERELPPGSGEKRA